MFALAARAADKYTSAHAGISLVYKIYNNISDESAAYIKYFMTSGISLTHAICLIARGGPAKRRNWPPRCFSQFYILRALAPPRQIWKLMRFESIMVFITQSSSPPLASGEEIILLGSASLTFLLGISQCASAAPSFYTRALHAMHIQNESFPNHWSLWIGWPTMYYTRTHICVRVSAQPAPPVTLLFHIGKWWVKNDQRKKICTY
jgi:hypothetical protein